MAATRRQLGGEDMLSEKTTKDTKSTKSTKMGMKSSSSK